MKIAVLAKCENSCMLLVYVMLVLVLFPELPVVSVGQHRTQSAMVE